MNNSTTEEDPGAENERLKGWVSDLQSGMYVNCVYCGHRYGPKDKVPVSMADILKDHIEKCPKHPMSHLRRAAKDALRALETSKEPSPLCPGKLYFDSRYIRTAIAVLKGALGKKA